MLTGLLETVRVLRVELDENEEQCVVKLGKMITLDRVRFDFGDIDHLEITRVFQEQKKLLECCC